jgi:sigma-B regulation protein RsbU (phosphoserine phosphatase)
MMFVTAIVGHVALSTGEIVVVDAGHNPGLRLCPDGALSRLDVPKGMALGVMEDFDYVDTALALPPGHTIVLYTDGATDARSGDGDLFGAGRLEQVIAGAAALPVKDLVQTVVRAVEAFAEGAPPEDDLTVLALRYRGGGG